MSVGQERAALVALLRRAPRGWSDVASRVEDAGSALTVLSDLGGSDQPSLFDAAGIPARELDRAAADVEQWEASGYRLVTILDDDYPERLITVHQRPPLLFMQGTTALADRRAVAVVGTREASFAGLQQATELAKGLAVAKVPVVSGLARGIDTAAHTAALDGQGRTVAVIGTGLARAYPRENAALQRRIAVEGLLISQFWPDSPPTKFSFPMRNAVMSGYTVATVVVEAAYRSGARMQARLALEHNRHVFLMRSLLEHEWARDYAARPNVSVAQTVDDVLAGVDDLMKPVGDLVWA